MHIHIPVDAEAFKPGAAADGVTAGAIDLLVGRDQAFLERHEGHERLPGGAWRHHAHRGPVEQRRRGTGREPLPFGGRHGAREEVGIEIRHADHGQHFAVVRIEGDDGAAFVDEEGFGEGLEPAIESQVEIVPAGRMEVRAAVAEAADFQAVHVYQAQLVAKVPPEDLLITSFQTGFSDEVPLPIVRIQPAFQFGSRDFAGVAQHMRRVGRGEVAAFLFLVVPDARQAVRVFLEPAEDFEGHFAERGARAEGTPGPGRGEPVLNGGIGHAEYLGQQPDLRLVEEPRCDRDRVGKLVIDHQPAIAVDDRPARRDHPFLPNGDALRLARIGVGVDQLQLRKADAEHQQQE